MNEMKKPKITNNTITDIFNLYLFKEGKRPVFFSEFNVCCSMKSKERNNITDIFNCYLSMKKGKKKRDNMKNLLLLLKGSLLPLMQAGRDDALERQTFHKLMGPVMRGRDIASEIEKGIEITKDNIYDWNAYCSLYYDELGGRSKKYSIGDMVSAFDYIKDPYDILHTIDSDGNYRGGLVHIYGFSKGRPKIQIDTVNKKVIYSGWDYTSSFPHNNDDVSTDELLEEFWNSSELHRSLAYDESEYDKFVEKNKYCPILRYSPGKHLSYDYTFSIPYNNDFIGINEVLETYWEAQQCFANLEKDHAGFHYD